MCGQTSGLARTVESIFAALAVSRAKSKMWPFFPPLCLPPCPPPPPPPSASPLCVCPRGTPGWASTLCLVLHPLLLCALPGLRNRENTPGSDVLKFLPPCACVVAGVAPLRDRFALLFSYFSQSAISDNWDVCTGIPKFSTFIHWRGC